MTALNWGEVHAFVAACKAAGVTPPNSVLRALHILEVAASMIPAPTGPLLGASDEQVRERVEALSIRAHNGGPAEVGRGMNPGVEQVSDTLAEELRGAAIPELDALIESLQPTFDEAARPLVVAAREFGIEAGTSSDDIIGRVDFADAVVAWRATRSAWFQIEPIVRWRIQLSRTFRLSPTIEETRRAGHIVMSDEDVNTSVLFVSGDAWSLDPSRYRVQGDRRQHMDWFQLARAGLHLATVTEVTSKIQAAGFRPFTLDTQDVEASEDEDTLQHVYPMKAR